MLLILIHSTKLLLVTYYFLVKNTMKFRANYLHAYCY